MTCASVKPAELITPAEPPLYNASGWRRNGHLQTLYSALVFKSHRLAYSRERVVLSDNDFLDLDWFGKGDRLTALILHGLSGSSESTYMFRTASALAQIGVSCCCMNLRGCSGEPNRLIRSYHSGQIEDLQFVLDRLRDRKPTRRFVLVGFSLGGNLLLRWLGEKPDTQQVLGAITISATMDLQATLLRLNRWPSALYQFHLTRLLLETTKSKARRPGTGLSPQAFRGVTGFSEFDDTYTAPFNGFVNAQEYYRWASARRVLGNIEIPTWLVNAKDDPFMDANGLPDPHELSPMVRTLFSAHGGHVGFLERASKPKECGRWQPSYDRFVTSFAEGLLS